MGCVCPADAPFNCQNPACPRKDPPKPKQAIAAEPAEAPDLDGEPESAGEKWRRKLGLR